MDAEIDMKTFTVLTADIVSAYLRHNTIEPSRVPALIAAVHGSLVGQGQPVIEEPPPLAPAVPVKKSVHPDYLVCLEDGQKLKMLKRHLANAYDLTPAQYRAKWGLPSDYPMVAPSYAERRSALAKSIGLGRRALAPVPAPIVKRRRAKRT
ncbi:putative transcriptional regulator [Endobacter medicaginis]|uniref:MucR family transcriptional regulator n=1 Tax=Endobacter medicaginis TaxID=1181271 RepID=A0A850NNH6_9PROT|nr:MucR family transcriptional regulator [Endobacter medicaginis]MBB3175605.1 putative transcriptional regulator [Endobacter medicaginis]MCX5476929.1 MucR family transcriptional regulator [Endobacter medicaginis]NVN29426.1 MucR family transcriptional regulator [Endobacter medicaginis]